VELCGKVLVKMAIDKILDELIVIYGQVCWGIFIRLKGDLEPQDASSIRVVIPNPLDDT